MELTQQTNSSTASAIYIEANLGTKRTKKRPRLLDTGSNLSLVDESIARYYKWDLNTSDEQFYGFASPIKVDVVGFVDTFGFIEPDSANSSGKPQPIRFQARFYVVEKLTAEFILGMDFMKAYKVDLLISKNCASISDEGQEYTFPIVIDEDQWYDRFLDYVQSRYTYVKYRARTPGT